MEPTHNIVYLKGSFGCLIEQLKESVQIQLINILKDYNANIDKLEGDFLKLVINAFGFNVIENFIVKGKKFFNALPIITTYEGFLDLLESIFLSREVNIKFVNPGEIEIVVVNNNQGLIKKYIDIKEQDYVDKDTINYKGFKSQELLGLEAFFKKFLEPFLAAGIKINKLTLIDPKIDRSRG